MPSKPPSPKRSAISRRLRQRLIRFLSAIAKGIVRAGQTVAATIGRIRRRDQLLALLLLLIWIVLLWGNFYVRGISRFEGSLITRSMSFTYTGEVDKQFLNGTNLTKLTLQGKQPETLVLTGKFSSPDPDLNAKLKRLSQLEIQLPDPQSGLTLEAANAKQTNAIDLRSLRILPHTQVEQLTYYPKANQLKFCLQSGSAADDGCESSSPTEPDSAEVGKLEFGVNSAAMNLVLVKAQISALEITTETLETQLRWQSSDAQDFVLPLVSHTSLQLSLPKINNNTADDAAIDITQLIRGDISVKQVRFAQWDRIGNVNDDIEASEILEGEVRMMGQSLKLQPRQFLIIPTDRHFFDKPNCRMSPTQNPGIQRLRDIRLNLKEPQGLQTLVSGESKCLAIGLYQDFPTQSIEPSWLLKYLPQEGINAIYTLIGAFTGILFPRLFPDKDDSKN